MARALAEARACLALDEVPVGACLVGPDGSILAQAGNRMRSLGDPTAHAEILALRAGAGRLGRARLDGCDLYVTLEPCAMCAGAIGLARLRRLYYGAGDEKAGAVAHGVRFFASPACRHAPEVYDGLAEREAAELLRRFFAARRHSCRGAAGLVR